MRPPNYKKKDVILITCLSCRQDIKFNELPFTPYARSPIKARDVIIWIMLPNSTLHKATGALFWFYPSPSPLFVFKSVPALTANREEPVTRFIGHCLRGSEYLGLKIEFFSALSQNHRK